uniref:Uncharacterized protein n=1 Tax=Cupriavidus pinatubonensis (strain JMP 134 / LMG 1197) TaxID=264198 RepID=Q46MM0_CUPPJ
MTVEVLDSVEFVAKRPLRSTKDRLMRNCVQRAMVHCRVLSREAWGLESSCRSTRLNSREARFRWQSLPSSAAQRGRWRWRWVGPRCDDYLIDVVSNVATLVARLVGEYQAACARGVDGEELCSNDGSFHIHIVDMPICDPNTRTYDSPDRLSIHLDRLHPALGVAFG